VTYLFQDEFDGPAGAPPNPARWAFDTSPGPWPYNGELQRYTNDPANCFQDGQGNLVIRALRTATGGYTSARINTLGRFAQAYGNWEARVKLRSLHGLWPAWWVMGANEPVVGWPVCGEVDILEDYGWSTVETTVHEPDPLYVGMIQPVRGVTYQDVPVDDQWHTWRMTWTSRTYRFYKDGTLYLTVRYRERKPAFMILNLAVGGAAGAPPVGTAFPADLLIDYVRVW
jgi:beta-glucanase (GH16 family)